ncbi:Ephrin-A5b AL-1 EPH-related receptor tyrosine kinase ligand 7 [Triplophysa tibetana]|uniref:Ephrin-A5b AL-1 EPH-related receptor tyrosine kinase ligand 7 n=1 Tax=Triplophysa tibetana TaxID=1572043 RepID=A0A5A9PC36_9TELE|nr:Ephrin-A5b AL-1 EPH-related receptor tyrosine kinase ligand 7 [Triplophysa tibetana]
MLQVEMFYFVGLSLWMSVLGLEPASKVVADRYAVYWNQTNPREKAGRFALCTFHYGTFNPNEK